MSTSSNTSLGTGLSGIFTNTSNIIGTHAASHAIGSIYTSNTSNSYHPEPYDISKSPFCRISLTKSENNGIVMELRITDKYSTHSTKEPKLYVISSVENLGKEIQNAVTMEILKQ
jgi:hypothetical protein